MDPGQDIENREFDPYRLVDPYEKRSKRRGLGRAGGLGAEGSGADGSGADDALAEDYATWIRNSERRRRRLTLVFALVLLLFVAAFGGFIAYDSFREPDISAYAQTGITVSGLEEADFIITPEELAALPIMEISATGSGKGPNGESRAGTVRTYGPTIEAFLQSRGYTLSDFRRIVFLCKDGYSVVLRPDDLQGDVILSIASGKDPLAAYQQPLRIIVPEGATHQWTFGILRIEFWLAADGDTSEQRRSERGSDGEGEDILTPEAEGAGILTPEAESPDDGAAAAPAAAPGAVQEGQ
jgi:hypothetical protein